VGFVMHAFSVDLVPSTRMREAVEAIRTGDPRALSALLRDDPALARKGRLVVEAGRLASLGALGALHAAGADLDASWRGYRALHALIQERPHGDAGAPSAERLACLDWLLEHGADPERTGAWPPARALLVAAFTGIAPFVERLRGRSRSDGFTAAALGDERGLARALEDPAFPLARDEGGLTALQCALASRLGRDDAAVCGRLRACAERLLDAGADANARTRAWSEEVDCAYFAVAGGDLARFELVLDRGADPTAALPSAAWQGGDEWVAAALHRGARPDVAESNGLPLLNDLVRWGQVERALALLERGAAPDVVDERGWTALHQAASRGSERMVEALLRAGADPSRADADGATPLDVARERGRSKLVRRLTAGE
jgi:hypothetical protein